MMSQIGITLEISLCGTTVHKAIGGPSVVRILPLSQVLIRI
jgi:hypothetical protein